MEEPEARFVTSSPGRVSQRDPSWPAAYAADACTRRSIEPRVELDRPILRGVVARFSLSILAELLIQRPSGDAERVRRCLTAP